MRFHFVSHGADAVRQKSVGFMAPNIRPAVSAELHPPVKSIGGKWPQPLVGIEAAFPGNKEGSQCV